MCLARLWLFLRPKHVSVWCWQVCCKSCIRSFFLKCFLIYMADFRFLKPLLFIAKWAKRVSFLGLLKKDCIALFDKRADACQLLLFQRASHWDHATLVSLYNYLVFMVTEPLSWPISDISSALLWYVFSLLYPSVINCLFVVASFTVQFV